MCPRKVLFLILLACCFSPLLGSSIALGAGIALSLSFGNPFAKESAKYSKKLLQYSVVGLGFGIEFTKVLEEGKQSLPYTITTIIFALSLGALLGKALRVNWNISRLISFGTAICGGSAIAALAPTIKAKQEEIAIALATVFTLNAVALFVFPVIGHFLNMDQEAFGLWAALGIHDTSSVVGAASSYGQIALETSVTIKLTRALWIIPFVLLFSLLEGSGRKVKIPLFILGFIAASALRSFFPDYQTSFDLIATFSKQLLVVTLFLIGSGLSKGLLKQVGFLPLIQGVTLWLALSITTLLAILGGLIKA